MQNLISKINEAHCLSEYSESIQFALKDIIENLTFDNDLQIFHPQYKTWKLSSDIQSRFKQLPDNSRQYHLLKHLRTYLYGFYYNGSLRNVLSTNNAESFTEDLSHTSNNQVVGVDIDLFQQLHANNEGIGYFDLGWQVIKIENDGAIAVSKNNLLLHIDPKLHLSNSHSEYHPSAIVDIKMTKNRLQDGFYVAMSNNSGTNELSPDNTTVRIYFNLLVQGSSILMHEITTRLNDIEIPFSFKLPYSRSNYQRFDAGVLYIFKSDYSKVATIVSEIFPVVSEFLGSEVPLFTKMLTPGIGLAEEPKVHFEEKESFGLNRCHILAQSLCEISQNSPCSFEKKVDFIFGKFQSYNVDLKAPYLNDNSFDIYDVIRS